MRVFAIPPRVSVHEDRLRAKLVCRAQRQRRMHAEFARRVGRRRYHPALIGPATYYHGPAHQRWIVELFHRYEERVHIDMEESAHLTRVAIQGGTDHRWDRPSP